MTETTVTNNLLTAIETIAQSVVDKVSYDKTVTCTIVDATYASDGKYTVSDGSTKFTAYSDITTYEVDDTVYVTIPNGDYSQQKTITGKKATSSDEPFNYASPFTYFLPCTPNLLDDNEATNQGENYGLLANSDSGDLIWFRVNDDGTKEELDLNQTFYVSTGTRYQYEEVTDIVLGSQSYYIYNGGQGPYANYECYLPKDDTYISSTLRTQKRIYHQENISRYYKNFDRIGIKADFRSWLSSENIKSGNYGLCLEVVSKENDVTNSGSLSDVSYALAKSMGFDEQKEYYIRKEILNSNNEVTGYDYQNVRLQNNIDTTYNNYSDYYSNFYYYKNFTLDTYEFATEDRDYYYFYDDGKSAQKYFPVNEETSTYAPDTYYYLPNGDEDYILATANGYDSSATYYLDSSGSSVVSLTYDTYQPGVYYVAEGSDETITQYMYLQVEDMIGNAYSFAGFMEQEAVFDLSNLGDIQELTLYFFQDNDFITTTGNYYTPPEELDYENLFTTNIELYFGYDISAIEDEYLQIFTYNSLNYQPTTNENENIKNIYLKWAHLQDDQVYVLEEDNLDSFMAEKLDTIEALVVAGDESSATYDSFTFKLDNSLTAVEDRYYFERESIEEYDGGNVSISDGKYQIPCNLTWTQNKSTEYNSNIMYYEYGIFDKDTDLFKIDSYGRYSYEVCANGDEVDETAYYLRLVTDDKDSDTQHWEEVTFEAGTAIDTSTGTYAKRVFTVLEEDDENITLVRGYKPVYGVTEDSDIYDYYYPNFYASDDGNYLVTYIIASDEENFVYEPGKYFYIFFGDEDFDIRWYRYVQGASSADEYSGIYWKRIPSEYSTVELEEWSNDETYYVYSNGNYIKATDENWSNGDTLYTYADLAGETHVINKFECEFHPNATDNATEKVKAIILYEGEPYYSNTLEFTNNAEVTNSANIQAAYALRGSFTDDSLGNYYLYDESNNLLDTSQATAQRGIKLLFDLDDYTSSSLLKNAESVTWIFPLENTMIDVLASSTSGEYSVNTDGTYGYITDTVAREEYVLYYNIGTYYSYSKANNAIVCNIVKDGVQYSATFNLQFGQSGSNGTEYTLALTLNTADNVITLNTLTADETNGLYYLTYEQIEPVKATSYDENIIYYSYSTNNDKYTIKTFDEEPSDITQYYYYEDLDTDETYYVLDDQVYVETTLADWNLTDKLFTKTKYTQVLTSTPVQSVYYYLNDDGEYIETTLANHTEEITVTASLYDQSHSAIDLKDYDITWDWFVEKGSLLTIKGTLDSATCVLGYELNGKSSDNMDNIFILRATLTNFGDTDIVSYLPIPIRPTFEPVRYQGPTQIIYSASGTPSYYKDEIKLYYNTSSGEYKAYDLDEGKFQIYCSTYVKDTSNVYKESRKYYTYNDGEYTPISLTDETYSKSATYYYISEYLPTLTYTEADTENKMVLDSSDTITEDRVYYSDSEKTEEVTFSDEIIYTADTYYYEKTMTTEASYILTPISFYVKDTEPFAIQFISNNEIIWTQPILYIQNRYFSSTLNNWDGSLTLDENDGTILARALGVGKKNTDNTFSGVILGDWSGNVSAQESTTNDFDIGSNIGIYGINSGVTSFGFTEAGNGFIGKSGHGRIIFDGNDSVIKSSNWNLDNESSGGMYLDIDDGFLLMRNGAIGSAFIKMNVLASGGYTSAENGKLTTDSYVNTQPSAGAGNDSDYPFVIAKDDSNFTKIGWNGNIYLKGDNGGSTEDSYPEIDIGKENYTENAYYIINSDGEYELSSGDYDENETYYEKVTSSSSGGFISINAAAEAYPINVNGYFGVGWDGSLTVAQSQLANDSFEQVSKIIKYIDKRDAGTQDNKYNYIGNDIISIVADSAVTINGTSYTPIAYANNKYDYSGMVSTFKGMYATQEGDLFLSRKLIIGSKFAANSDGYLRAENGLFEDCNANVFNVKYLPNGANCSINFNKTGFDSSDYNKVTDFTYAANKYYYIENGEYILDTSEEKSDRDYYELIVPAGTTIGTMGWVEGSSGDATTYNLGFKSENNCGIKLDSSTNVSFAASAGIYSTSDKYEINATGIINIFQNGKTPAVDTDYLRLYSINGIREKSQKAIQLITGVSNSDTHASYWNISPSEAITGAVVTEEDENGDTTSTVTTSYTTAFDTALVLDPDFIRLHWYNGSETPQVRFAIGPDTWRSTTKDSETTNPDSDTLFAFHSKTATSATDKTPVTQSFKAFKATGGANLEATGYRDIAFTTDAAGTITLTGQANTDSAIYDQALSSYVKIGGADGLKMEGITYTLSTGNTNINCHSGTFNFTSTILTITNNSSGNSITVKNISPENQEGIYARFA